jgi:hypothetical protein
MKYFRKNKQFLQYRGTPSMHKLYDKEFMEFITNGVVQKTTYQELVWISPTNLVPKQNGKILMVIDTRKLNAQMKLIHFKLEGVLTLIRLIKCVQSCSSPSSDAASVRSMLEGRVLQVRRDALWSERRPKSIFKNNETCSEYNSRTLAGPSCDLFGRPYNSSSKSDKVKRNSRGNNPFSSVVRMDSKH